RRRRILRPGRKGSRSVAQRLAAELLRLSGDGVRSSPRLGARVARVRERAGRGGAVSGALQERHDSLTGLAGLKRAKLVLALDVDLRAEVVRARGGEGALDVGDDCLWGGGDRASEFFRLVRELLGGDDAVDHADRQ